VTWSPLYRFGYFRKQIEASLTHNKRKIINIEFDGKAQSDHQANHTNP
jgi:hypothetical protein